MSTDAIVPFKNNHKDIRKLTNDFEKPAANERSAKSRLVDRIIELLIVHTNIEVMSTRVRELLPDNGGEPRSYPPAGRNGAWRRG